MASSRTAEREEERRSNMRTLVIASAASATAAVVTSQLWIAGTWIAAAMTPVIVALVSELLHRPTEKIAGRLTSDRAALGGERVVGDRPAPPAADAPETGPIRVYRTSPAPRRGRKIAFGAVLGTGALALLIAVVALTVPELIAGGAIGKSDSRTTLFRGGGGDSAPDEERQRAPAEQNDRDRSAKDPPPTDTTTEETTTEPPPAEETTPTTPTTPTEEQPPADTAPAPAEP